MSGFAETKVQKHNGVPTLFVDGQPLHAMTATSVAFDDAAVISDFVRAGVEIMMIWIEVPLKCWTGPGQYDWTYAEEKLRFFEQHSADTHWIIRVRLGLMAEWFRHTFPDEVHNPPSKDPVSSLSVGNIVSSIWLEQVSQVLQDFVTWLRGTRWADRIIGFMLNAGATEEWLIFDTEDATRGKYHPAVIREFRAWLQQSYHSDVAALRKAWAAPETAFDSATPPSGMMRKGSHIWGPYSLRDPRTDRQAIDYYSFLNETLADALILLCRVAKTAAGTPIICGGFHSYLWWETGVYSYIQEYGHTLIQRLNQSPWVDFVSDITSYDNRYPGGPSGYLGLPHSLNLNTKLHYTEVDLRTVACLSEEQRSAWKKVDPATIPPRTALPALPDVLWKWNLQYCGRDDDEEIARLQREHFHNLVTGTPYWWFDIVGHNYQHPPLVDAIRRLSDIGKQAVNWNRSSISEVAFVCSEDTPRYQASMNGELIRFELESAHGLLLDLATRGWGTAGVPFDTYELHDLAHPDFPGEQYKLLIFVNCAYVSPRAAEGIRRWQNSQRTLCWTFAPAVLDDQQLDPTLGADLIGMRLGWHNQRRNIHVCMDGSVDHPLTRGGDTLNYGTEGSVGPVFFADDPDATVLGRLRDGGEAAFALRQHGTWNSVYLAMLNFGPALFRNLTRFAGAHVWCLTDDVLYANQSILCLHTATAGPKVIELPAQAIVTDLWTGERAAQPTRRLELDMPAYRTKAWRTQYEIK